MGNSIIEVQMSQNVEGEERIAKGNKQHVHTLNTPNAAKKLSFVLGLTLFFMIIEGVVGYFINSLALIADAGHMLNDVLSLFLALSALFIAQKRQTSNYTYGFARVEVLSGLISSISLIGISGYIFFEAMMRFTSDQAYEINGGLLLFTAIIGLLINLVSMKLLEDNSKENVNVEGAYQHIIADLLGSIAAIIAGISIIFWKIYLIDLIMSVLISIIILNSGINLGQKILRILLEASPLDFDMDELTTDLTSISQVLEVHDLHVWTITSGKHILTGHIIIEKNSDKEWVQDHLRYILNSKYELNHITLQIEYQACEPMTDCYKSNLANQLVHNEL